MTLRHRQIAGLPMYDPPELQPLVDAWWRGIAGALRAEGVPEVPDQLDRRLSLDALWSSPALMLTQTCGYPLRGVFAEHLQYLATPHYGAAGCNGATYCSFIVVATDSTATTLEDLRGARCSINARHSHSGFNALRAHVAPLARNGRFFASVHASGSHAASLAQVGRGDADVAAIDCVTHALLGRCRPQVIAATRIIGRTASASALPYATRIGASPDLVARLRAGLKRAHRDPELEAIRSELLISGLEMLPVETYDSMLRMEAEARRHGYVEMD